MEKIELFTSRSLQPTPKASKCSNKSQTTYSLPAGIVLSVAMMAFLPAAHAQQTWDGGAGTNEWMDAQNWSGDTRPNAEDADITNQDVVLTGDAGTVSRLNVGGRNGLSNAGSLDVQTGGSLTLTGADAWKENGGLLTVSGGAVTFFNALARFSHRTGSNDRIVITDGSLTLDNARVQSFFGDFDVTVSGGSLNLTANQEHGFAVVGGEGTSTLTLSGTGEINSAGYDLGIGEVPHAGDNAPVNGNGTMEMTGGILSLDGSTADLIIGNSGLTSTGTANLSGGVATVGGNTFVDLGSLNLSGTADFTTDDLILSNGTSLTVTGSSIVNFIVTSNATLNDSNITFNADTGFSTITTDTLDLGLADLIIDLNGLDSGTYNLFSYGTLVGSAFENVTFLNGAGTIDYGTGSGDFISITAIPEPGTYALFAGLLGLSYVMIRRRA